MQLLGVPLQSERKRESGKNRQRKVPDMAEVYVSAFYSSALDDFLYVLFTNER